MLTGADEMMRNGISALPPKPITPSRAAKNASPSSLHVPIPPSVNKIDHVLKEAAEEAKQRSLRKMLKAARKREREAKSQRSVKDVAKVETRKKILCLAKKDLEEGEKWLVITDRYQVILGEQQRTLREERRRRFTTVKNATVALEKAQGRFAEGDKAQEEVSLLEQKLREA